MPPAVGNRRQWLFLEVCRDNSMFSQPPFCSTLQHEAHGGVAVGHAVDHVTYIVLYAEFVTQGEDAPPPVHVLDESGKFSTERR